MNPNDELQRMVRDIFREGRAELTDRNQRTIDRITERIVEATSRGESWIVVRVRNADRKAVRDALRLLGYKVKLDTFDIAFGKTPVYVWGWSETAPSNRNCQYESD